MAKSSSQKLKIVYLMKILYERTDEEHPMSTSELISALSEYNVRAERKTLYDDLQALEHYGMDICRIRSSHSTGYYVGSREFEVPELEMLIDSVQASKFITEKKTHSLIRKLRHLGSIHQASALNRQVFVKNRIKSMNETIYLNVDLLHAAIANNQQISFLYFEYNLEKKRVYRHNNKLYQVSPYALIWDNENYYLLAYDAGACKIKHYRVDKMAKIARLSQERLGKASFSQIDLAEYTKQNFSMFGGNLESVTLRFANPLVGVVLDRFGKDIIIEKDGDTHFRVTLSLAVSPQFYGFLFSLGTDAEILRPEHVRREFQAHLQTVSEKYPSDPF